MTALLDFPVTSDLVPEGYAVTGASALVPRTSLRLPLAPVAVRIPVDERCPDCAGTGIMFDGGHRRATNTLMSCGCMALPIAAARPRVAVVDYVEPDYS